MEYYSTVKRNICNSMNEFQNNYTEWKKADKKITHMTREHTCIIQLMHNFGKCDQCR